MYRTVCSKNVLSACPKNNRTRVKGKALTLTKEDEAMNGTRRRGLSAKQFSTRGTVRGSGIQSAAQSGRSAAYAQTVIVEEVTRNVPVSVQCLLWGRAAGRCEFGGCNQPLWKSRVTQEQVNIAEKAHIYSFGSRGPRGNIGISVVDLHNLSNLMLVCHACHRKIDRKRDGGRYTVSLLQQMKAAHERRIEVVSAIAPEKSSHVLLYGASIGDHSSPLSYTQAASALFPDRYPAADRAIELSVHNSSFCDRDAGFWQNEAFELTRKFDRQVRLQVAEGGIHHLSVFAIAPQPLLILLGSLLGDIVPCDVYQRHREPITWQWPPEHETQSFRLLRPTSLEGQVALVFEVSATVKVERIHQVLGEKASVWSIGVPAPHNDVMKSSLQKAEFRALVRTALDQIKGVHGQTAILHVFPAMPVSLAVELGRVRMPKADMPWLVYDQVNARGGFVRALTIPDGEQQ
jgi:SMODS-associated and fused to various effectors sensor domain